MTTNHRGTRPARPCGRKAFVVVDSLIALGIVATLALGLSAAVHRAHTAEAALSDSRAAVHLAEHALLSLQHGQPMPPTTGEIRLRIQPVTDGTAPTGFIWAKAIAVVHGHERSLIGIVPAGSISSSGAQP